MSADKVRDAMDQLSRYGGEPHESLGDLLLAVADLNDDIHHMRSLPILVSIGERIKTELNKLIHKPPN